AHVTLADFEREIFAGRLDADARTEKQRLVPLPGRTTLQEIYCDSDAATYFRHRFTLFSRYAGALTDRACSEIRAWDDRERDMPAAWTLRIAMLAELSRLQLTRPQLRTLIPLTTTLDGNEARPPVAAFLQEPPFARGGLADRIAADVKLGFSYEF